MDFTLHQLKIFAEVAICKSITRASQSLNMTQPAVSIQLKNFQNQFDIPLYEVIGKKLYITQFGNEIFEIAQDILNKVASVHYKTQSFKGLLSGKLRVSVVSTGNYVMPYFIKGFLNHHPNVALQVDVSNKAKVIKDLEENKVDFSLVTVNPSHLKINEQPIMLNKLYLVGSKSSDFYSKEALKPPQFNTLPLIFREVGSGTRHTMQQFFKVQNITPKIKLELSSNEAIKQAVMANIGLSIVSLLSIKNELEQGDLTIIPVDGLPLTTQWKLIWLKSKTLTPIAEAFLEFVSTHQSTIYNTYFKWQEKY